MSEISTTFLFHRQRKEPVEVTFLDAVERTAVAEAQSSWSKLLNGINAEHSHWNWNDKYQLVAEAPLAYRIMGIEAEGQMQGLILLLASFAKLTARRANH